MRKRNLMRQLVGKWTNKTDYIAIRQMDMMDKQDRPDFS